MQKYNKMQQEIADDLTYQITDDIKHSTRHYKLSDFDGEFKFTEYTINANVLTYKVKINDKIVTYDISYDGINDHWFEYDKGKFEYKFVHYLTEDFVIDLAKYVQKRVNKCIEDAKKADDPKLPINWLKNTGKKFNGHSFNVVFKDGAKAILTYRQFGACLIIANNLHVKHEEWDGQEYTDPSSGWDFQSYTRHNWLKNSQNRDIIGQITKRKLSFPTVEVETMYDESTDYNDLVELCLYLNHDPEQILNSKLMKLNINCPDGLLDPKCKISTILPTDEINACPRYKHDMIN